VIWQQKSTSDRGAEKKEKTHGSAIDSFVSANSAPLLEPKGISRPASTVNHEAAQ